MTDAPDLGERHLARMLRKKAVIDERIANSPNECGLLLVLTGNGKGKSSSAFGMLARAMGHGMQWSLIHFLSRRRTVWHCSAFASCRCRLDCLPSTAQLLTT
ncbi:cob(I)yrinic acid a,c-diamide adenosyltransferase [Leclercia adecarboxylata]|uniref:cob(I)yrinic acid a,c-diamide adenosyltransferase n=1 Tax=Leclercia adecarboxylata TaxID=83655 RepID=UPI00234C09D6|nr:cob(I)yrinic acid a,c-diamide adenosyltransferase [Leclercia adecarboxylata]MDC6652548.1 cob(I)yrinic acid a,c-diamide adenosyltransferase [Leclercia adecarboxylata]